ncbi:unnamed protein product [Amoebophrya sp. A25]|nr:unnamed protein product [Amoebophrya sp. A25]|eukprot:GSA25T00009769001.1
MKMQEQMNLARPLKMRSSTSVATKMNKLSRSLVHVWCATVLCASTTSVCGAFALLKSGKFDEARRRPPSSSLLQTTDHIATHTWQCGERAIHQNEGVLNNRKVSDDRQENKFKSQLSGTATDEDDVDAGDDSIRVARPQVDAGSEDVVVDPPPQPFNKDLAELGVPGLFPTIGSVNHPHGCADPCKYARKARGCKDGARCDRCHLCSPAKQSRAPRRKNNSSPLQVVEAFQSQLKIEESTTSKKPTPEVAAIMQGQQATVAVCSREQQQLSIRGEKEDKAPGRALGKTSRDELVETSIVRGGKSLGSVTAGGQEQEETSGKKVELPAKRGPLWRSPKLQPVEVKPAIVEQRQYPEQALLSRQQRVEDAYQVGTSNASSVNKEKTGVPDHQHAAVALGWRSLMNRARTPTDNTISANLQPSIRSSPTKSSSSKVSTFSAGTLAGPPPLRLPPGALAQPERGCDVDEEESAYDVEDKKVNIATGSNWSGSDQSQPQVDGASAPTPGGASPRKRATRRGRRGKKGGKNDNYVPYNAHSSSTAGYYLYNRNYGMEQMDMVQGEGRRKQEQGGETSMKKQKHSKQGPASLQRAVLQKQEFMGESAVAEYNDPRTTTTAPGDQACQKEVHVQGDRGDEAASSKITKITTLPVEVDPDKRFEGDAPRAHGVYTTDKDEETETGDELFWDDRATDELKSIWRAEGWAGERVQGIVNLVNRGCHDPRNGRSAVLPCTPGGAERQQEQTAAPAQCVDQLNGIELDAAYVSSCSDEELLELARKYSEKCYTVAVHSDSPESTAWSPNARLIAEEGSRRPSIGQTRNNAPLVSDEGELLRLQERERDDIMARIRDEEGVRTPEPECIYVAPADRTSTTISAPSAQQQPSVATWMCWSQVTGQVFCPVQTAPSGMESLPHQVPAAPWVANHGWPTPTSPQFTAACSQDAAAFPSYADAMKVPVPRRVVERFPRSSGDSFHLCSGPKRQPLPDIFMSSAVPSSLSPGQDAAVCEIWAKPEDNHGALAATGHDVAGATAVVGTTPFYAGGVQHGSFASTDFSGDASSTRLWPDFAPGDEAGVYPSNPKFYREGVASSFYLGSESGQTRSPSAPQPGGGNSADAEVAHQEPQASGSFAANLPFVDHEVGGQRMNAAPGAASSYAGGATEGPQPGTKAMKEQALPQALHRDWIPTFGATGSRDIGKPFIASEKDEYVARHGHVAHFPSEYFACVAGSGIREREQSLTDDFTNQGAADAAVAIRGGDKGEFKRLLDSRRTDNVYSMQHVTPSALSAQPTFTLLSAGSSGASAAGAYSDSPSRVSRARGSNEVDGYASDNTEAPLVVHFPGVGRPLGFERHEDLDQFFAAPSQPQDSASTLANKQYKDMATSSAGPAGWSGTMRVTSSGSHLEAEAQRPWSHQDYNASKSRSQPAAAGRRRQRKKRTRGDREQRGEDSGSATPVEDYSWIRPGQEPESQPLQNAQ